jgi:hypothetical protein
MSKSPKHADCVVGSEAQFSQLLHSENQRSERSGRPFVVLTLRMSQVLEQRDGAKKSDALFNRIGSALRETDRIGWYEAGTAIGVICTEIGTSDPVAAGKALAVRLTEHMAGLAGSSAIVVSFATYPQPSKSRHPATAAQPRPEVVLAQ